MFSGFSHLPETTRKHLEPPRIVCRLSVDVGVCNRRTTAWRVRLRVLCPANVRFGDKAPARARPSAAPPPLPPPPRPRRRGQPRPPIAPGAERLLAAALHIGYVTPASVLSLQSSPPQHGSSRRKAADRRACHRLRCRRRRRYQVHEKDAPGLLCHGRPHHAGSPPELQDLETGPPQMGQHGRE
jgi:hypothetical protein